MTYTVFYRRCDGVGTRAWDKNLSRAEAVAQKRWCFQNPATGATMVWVMDEHGRMFGEPLMKDVSSAA